MTPSVHNGHIEGPCNAEQAEQLRQLSGGRWEPTADITYLDAEQAIWRLGGRRRRPPVAEEVAWSVESYNTPDGESWLYVIQAGGPGGPIKIGITIDPEYRLEQLQTGNPIELRLLHVVSGGRETEQRLHAELASSRIRGEWFNVTKEVVEAIRRLLAEPGRVSWRDRKSAPHGAYQLGCRVCGTSATINRETGMCGACREFADLRASGVDPFAEAS